MCVWISVIYICRKPVQYMYLRSMYIWKLKAFCGRCVVTVPVLATHYSRRGLVQVLSALVSQNVQIPPAGEGPAFYGINDRRWMAIKVRDTCVKHLSNWPATYQVEAPQEVEVALALTHCKSSNRWPVELWSETGKLRQDRSQRGENLPNATGC